MPHHLFSKYSKAAMTLALACLLTGFLAACGGSSTSSSNGPVTITVWSWVPNFQQAVDLFEKSHPNIKVKLDNVGQGGTEYPKLRTALKAGSGAPDVVQLEYSELPTFAMTGKLVDLSQYGADAYKNDYISWAWAQSTQGDKIYAIPQDSGPMGMLYREDIFKKYNLAVPTTWDQFQQEAIALHKADPKVYMTNFAPNDAAAFTSYLWQAKARPYTSNGTNVSVNLSNEATQKVANYWDDLINSGAVQTIPDFANDWNTELSNGTLATWITAAWAPTDLAGIASSSSGKWRVAPLPQWNAGDNVSANWGGSTDAVTTQSQHPKEAAEFAMWINHDKTAANMLSNQLFLYPTLKSVLNDPSFGTSVPFYGGQNVNKIFAQSSAHVDTSFQWTPFQDYINNQLTVQLGNAVNGKASMAQALQQAQNDATSYAKAQGFTVSNK
ncbi:ABC transporter substrate-binding protein [Dictyobacter arantiisoli]|uniref:Sugar ABC transporter substrate-binding protein n=1 Tax=Dictyobacter arantiisoli TaxID=2014874 RepID=A0A5A5TH50_9CHLR|nr:sugar ABC transporter substrate-binding protein [Dictyobacter arantiisoli]GCF10565.1 sugar ABC transporter substrate-binding protein [Dictyobacter arantiisoli]